MAEEQGSRWYFPTFEGLYDAKHVRRMGPAIWLYGWILARAYAAKADGVMIYSHMDAARELGIADKTARLWFERLRENSYLITRARRSHHLEVEVTNWRGVEEWLKDRAERAVKSYRSRSVDSYRSEVEAEAIGEVNGNSLPESEENGKVIGKVIGKPLPVTHITIRLLGYEYPDLSTDQGASAPGGTLTGAFAGILERLKNEPNKAGLLHEIYVLCFGEQDVPAYGYLGRVAKAVGGAGRLAEIMWQLSTKPPTGDIMAYILKAFGPSRGNGKGKGPVHDATQTDWQAEAVKWAPKT